MKPEERDAVIEALRATARKMRQTRADMLGTDDEEHYWHCHEAADLMDKVHTALTAQSPAGVPPEPTRVGRRSAGVRLLLRRATDHEGSDFSAHTNND